MRLQSLRKRTGFLHRQPFRRSLLAVTGDPHCHFFVSGPASGEVNDFPPRIAGEFFGISAFAGTRTA